jgi:S-phase kinase-associated protein 1
METIKNMLDDITDPMPIPLPNVDSESFGKVVEYLKQHANDPPEAENAEPSKIDDVMPWDADFMKLPQNEIFKLVIASNYLLLKGLLNLSCKTIANCIHGKTPEQIRKLFNIKNDFTPEEEATVRRENQWCEER